MLFGYDFEAVARMEPGHGQNNERDAAASRGDQDISGLHKAPESAKRASVVQRSNADAAAWPNRASAPWISNIVSLSILTKPPPN
jgi:hypothetical protein